MDEFSKIFVHHKYKMPRQLTLPIYGRADVSDDADLNSEDNLDSIFDYLVVEEKTMKNNEKHLKF